MMNQIIKDNQKKDNNQKISSLISSLDYRLDLLRLTFKIEEILESVIRESLKKKSILEKNFKDFFINEKKYKHFKKQFQKNSLQYQKIWNKKTNNKLYFNVKNFIIYNTFGGLLKFIKIIKYDSIKAKIRNINVDLEFKIFRKWMIYVKNIRNTLAHQTNIKTNNFLQKSPFPAQSKKLSTKKLTNIKLKKAVFVFLLPKEKRDDQITKVLKKYNFI